MRTADRRRADRARAAPVLGLGRGGAGAGGGQGRQHPAPGDAGDRPARRTALGGRPGRPAAPDARRSAASPGRTPRGDRRARADGPGWYAGPVGWMDATEDGEFCVALRSALLRDREARPTPASASSPAPTRRRAGRDRGQARRAAAAAERDERPVSARGGGRRVGRGTSIRPVPASRRLGEVVEDSIRRCGRPKSSATLARSTPRGVPSRASNSSRRGLLLGEEVEDAAAVVVDDHDPHRGLDLAQGGEAAHVVEEAEVAGDDRRRPAAGWAAPMPEETRPSMPLAPRLHRKRTSARARGRKDSWSRIGMEEAV